MDPARPHEAFGTCNVPTVPGDRHWSIFPCWRPWQLFGRTATEDIQTIFKIGDFVKADPGAQERSGEKADLEDGKCCPG